MVAANSTRPLSDLAIRNLKPGVTLTDPGGNKGLRVSKGKSGVTFLNTGIETLLKKIEAKIPFIR